MATKRPAPTPPPAAPARPPYMLIEEIRVQGYKSLVDATLHVRPLTLLAGTNSSGKSSIMQPLLLIKQTMEAPYTPAGALVLDGAHVQAETAGELVSKVYAPGKSIVFKFLGKKMFFDGPTIKLVGQSVPVVMEFSYLSEGINFLLNYQYFNYNERTKITLKKDYWDGVFPADRKEQNATVKLVNAFLELEFTDNKGNFAGGYRIASNLGDEIGKLMHIPGLRGKPQRSYPVTYFKDQIKGTFDLYTAGTISQWQQQNDTEKLIQLNNYLQLLDLTNSVTAKIKNANEIELSVNRLPATSKTRPRKTDMVNIADVGIGVSQVLPILVALIAAQEGQLVYVEQPELHLHPRAQVVMAKLLAEAANRGVRVIVETHSSLLLLTVQTLVAEGKIKPADVGLHWFARDTKGATTVTLAEVDENGAYGNWPEDFGDVELAAQSAYLNANTKRQPFKPATV